MAENTGAFNQRFRQVLEALPCGYLYGEVIVNGFGEPEDYTVLEVNHAFTEITSTIRDKVIGKRVAGLFSLSSVKEDIAVFAEVALTGDPVEKDFFSPHFGIHLRVFCFAPQEGFFIAMLTDLSREKKLENRIRFIEEFAGSTSDEFFIVDAFGRFVMGNSAVAAKLSTTGMGIPGHHISELNPIAEEGWWSTFWDSLVERKSLQFESDHRGKDGVVYPVELSIDLMEFGSRKYAAIVAKNISTRRILSKAIKQDRRFAEQASSMAGYFIWMIDSDGVFRSLLGGVSSIVSGPVNDVFFPLLHRDDRSQLAGAMKLKPSGSMDLRMKTDRGYVYHRFKWSPVEDNCIVGICYPLGGAGLSGQGSHSTVMDAVYLMTNAVYDKMEKLENALSQNNTAAASRMVRAIISEFSTVTAKASSPEKVRFSTYLSSNTGMLKQLYQNSISFTVDPSENVVGLCDPALLENALARLLLVFKSTDTVTSVSISTFSDSFNAGLSVAVAGKEGIQAALEQLFISKTGQMPGLASVYAMVRSGGGRVHYDTMDEKVEFILSFPRVMMDDDSAYIIVALPDSVDAARSAAGLKNAGYSVAVESSLSEILRRTGEGRAGILVLSASMPDFSLDEIRDVVSGVTLIQVGGEPDDTNSQYLPDRFRTTDLVTMVNEIKARVGKLQAEVLPGESLWEEPRPMPPL